jgi:hypothetical protein
LRRTDRASLQQRRPDGVMTALHVIGSAVEPAVPNRARNLLSKDDCRSTRSDEAVRFRPQVARVLFAGARAGNAPGLAGARAGPEGAGGWYACQAQGLAPPAESSKEMNLPISAKIARVDKLDISVIHVSIGDQAFGYEVA